MSFLLTPSNLAAYGAVFRR